MKLLNIIIVLLVVFCTVDLHLGDARFVVTSKHHGSTAEQEICERQCSDFAGKKGQISFNPEKKSCYCRDEFGNHFTFSVVING